jgi:hypothetical protein
LISGHLTTLNLYSRLLSLLPVDGPTIAVAPRVKLTRKLLEFFFVRSYSEIATPQLRLHQLLRCCISLWLVLERCHHWFWFPCRVSYTFLCQKHTYLTPSAPSFTRVPTSVKFWALMTTPTANPLPRVSLGATLPTLFTMLSAHYFLHVKSNSNLNPTIATTPSSPSMLKWDTTHPHLLSRVE